MAYLGRAQVLEEADLLGREEEESAAAALGTPGRPADAVDVLPGVIRGVVLDDPVHGGDVQACIR